ncbi:hypothetical protein [Nannocystis punicea]|uniref:Uncharacterized protein n=1 Tax=Nannocystis punicea TaxID=2995304 RepID=A0ABY7H6Q9_9BACT|nr:hypothetical protein [Nannocystis poenicansa]WAS94765.1 hypothetical protein O0S08_01280 [Nannocystis poenicansa]
MQPSKRPHLRALVPCALLLVVGGSCTQPTMNCTTAHLPYAAKYELTSGNPMSPCAQQKGDILGMQTYFATGGINGTAKFSDPSAAIRPQYSGLLIAEALNYPVDVPGFTGEKGVEHWPNALGDFESGSPDGDDLCHVPQLGPATFTRPELPAVADDPATEDDETKAVSPPTTVSYEWTDVRWLNTPDAQGTQFEADLKFTQDGCTAEYHVVAVSPAVECAADEDCTLTGNGLNPDFAVECATDIGLCVLAKPIPSYE